MRGGEDADGDGGRRAGGGCMWDGRRRLGTTEAGLKGKGKGEWRGRRVEKMGNGTDWEGTAPSVVGRPATRSLCPSSAPALLSVRIRSIRTRASMPLHSPLHIPPPGVFAQNQHTPDTPPNLTLISLPAHAQHTSPRPAPAPPARDTRRRRVLPAIARPHEDLSDGPHDPVTARRATGDVQTCPAVSAVI